MNQPLALHSLHESWGASFALVNDSEVVESYGDWQTEHAALTGSVGLVDLCFRGRLCLLGKDRQAFLNGQVTNDISRLETGQGCYAALVDAKARMESDLFAWRLPDEILIDVEPGFWEAVLQRLEKFIIADDASVVDAAPHYGLLSIQGPESAATIKQLALPFPIPEQSLTLASGSHSDWGEIYCANQPRLGSAGFDLFVPQDSLETAIMALREAVNSVGGRLCGWRSMETARVEAGIPRFGADMDNSNLAPETGIGDRAISYSKGCYIGQEIISRIRSRGRVNRSLCGLALQDDLPALPENGCVLFADAKKAGHLTSTVNSPSFGNIALGYVRRGLDTPGKTLELQTGNGTTNATIAPLPFQRLGDPPRES